MFQIGKYLWLFIFILSLVSAVGSESLRNKNLILHKNNKHLSLSSTKQHYTRICGTYTSNGKYQEELIVKGYKEKMPTGLLVTSTIRDPCKQEKNKKGIIITTKISNCTATESVMTGDLYNATLLAHCDVTTFKVTDPDLLAKLTCDKPIVLKKVYSIENLTCTYENEDIFKNYNHEDKMISLYFFSTDYSSSLNGYEYSFKSNKGCTIRITTIIIIISIAFILILPCLIVCIYKCSKKHKKRSVTPRPPEILPLLDEAFTDPHAFFTNAPTSMNEEKTTKCITINSQEIPSPINNSQYTPTPTPMADDENSPLPKVIVPKAKVTTNNQKLSQTNTDSKEFTKTPFLQDD